MSFPKFRDDLDVLKSEKIVKVTSSETCEWLKSKTSLAEYFKWIGWDAEWVPGGFWAPIEKVFGIKRHTLRKLAGNNANPLKPDESKDFIKIKKLLTHYREEEEYNDAAQTIYRYIKYLVLVESGDEKPEEITRVLYKISSLFKKNVDKNIQKRGLKTP